MNSPISPSRPANLVLRAKARAYLLDLDDYAYEDVLDALAFATEALPTLLTSGIPVPLVMGYENTLLFLLFDKTSERFVVADILHFGLPDYTPPDGGIGGGTALLAIVDVVLTLLGIPLELPVARLSKQRNRVDSFDRQRGPVCYASMDLDDMKEARAGEVSSLRIPSPIGILLSEHGIPVCADLLGSGSGLQTFNATATAVRPAGRCQTPLAISHFVDVCGSSPPVATPLTDPEWGKHASFATGVCWRSSSAAPILSTRLPA